MGALPTLYAATAPDVKGNDYYGPGRLSGDAGLSDAGGFLRRVARMSARRGSCGWSPSG